MVYCFICLLDPYNGMSRRKKKTTVQTVTNACTMGGGISEIRNTVQRALDLNVALIVVTKCLSPRGNHGDGWTWSCSDSLRIYTEKYVAITGRFVLRSKGKSAGTWKCSVRKYWLWCYWKLVGWGWTSATNSNWFRWNCDWKQSVTTNTLITLWTNGMKIPDMEERQRRVIGKWVDDVARSGLKRGESPI